MLPSSPLRTFRLRWRRWDWILVAFVVAFGAFFAALGAALIVKAWSDGDTPVTFPLAFFGPACFTAFGGFIVVHSVVSTIRRERIFTAVYTDRLAISTAWRSYDLPLGRIRRVVRESDSDGGYIVSIELASLVRTRDVAVQSLNQSEQDEFIELVNRLIAERPTP